jgi:four helix bundle protein
LSLQMRRAAVSIPANIAEGFRKRSRPDKARFMNVQSLVPPDNLERATP